MTRFIAIDGEGITRDERHDYVLLAASDGSYIEDYRENGLSTVECFEYLLQLGVANSDAILVGFYTSYDVNMIFRDLPESVLAALWQGSSCSWRADAKDFRQYRLEYIPNRMLRIKHGCWTMDEDGRSRWHTFRRVTWWDCFQFFQASFVKALSDWNVTDAATIERIASMKDARGVFDEAGKESVRSYCFDECRLLAEMMGKVSDTLDELGIALTSWYGAGSIASALMRAHGVRAHIRRDWSADMEDAIMSAYFGGRIETFAVGLVEGACYNYDIRSAYPSATVGLPSLADCEVEAREAYDYDEPYALWRVRWRKCVSGPVKLTPFPFRQKKRIYWPHTGEGWYHAEEVRAAFDVFAGGTRGIALEVVEGYSVRPATTSKPFEWVRELYELRAEYKRQNDAREKILKLGLNSLYGKCAQSIGARDGTPPPYQCYYWAGAITADCRARLLRAAASASDVLAIATDGLFVRERAAVVDAEVRDELGAWECTEVERGLLLIQPGVYASPSLGKRAGSYAKSRGFSARGIDYDALLRVWRERRTSAEFSFAETKFIGFGYALAVGKLSTLWRRWIRGEKTIHFSGTTSKSIDPGSDAGADLVRLCAPNAPGPLSERYVPRSRANAAEAELQSELLASQPDIDDNLFSWN